MVAFEIVSVDLYTRMYVRGVSKSIEPYFFPRKPMKRGRLPSVEGTFMRSREFFPARRKRQSLAVGL
jgi:hypothetical protein